MGTCEYCTLRINTAGGHLDTGDLDEQLNALGDDGWELMAVTPVISSGETMFLIFNFRRPGEPKRRAGFSV